MAFFGIFRPKKDHPTAEIYLTVRQSKDLSSSHSRVEGRPKNRFQPYRGHIDDLLEVRE